MFLKEPVLAIETSCDETSAAVVLGRNVLSNVVASQVEMHAKWGGVVPEAAARAHVEAILPVIRQARADAGDPKIAAIAVTNRPGLLGALSVGLTAAKALAFHHGVPMVGVHHLEGHIMSPYSLPDSEFSPSFPYLCAVVSGGHTELVAVKSPGSYQIIAETCDDAAGEAFDKGARLLGLGYPGGRAIQDAAESGDPTRYNLPRAVRTDPHRLSFSGLKTAMLRLVETEGSKISVADAAASLQAAIVDSLTAKAVWHLENSGFQGLSLVGGVAANLPLRTRLGSECQRRGLPFWTPSLSLCTDNAAMIGLAGSFRRAAGEHDGPDLDCFPNSPLPSPPGG